jgi:hypothetical protein
MLRDEAGYYQVSIIGLKSFAPAPYALGPAGKSLLGITARIKLFVSVQAQIKEVRGDIFPIWPFPAVSAITQDMLCARR